MVSQSTLKEVGGRNKKDGQAQVTMSAVMIEARSKRIAKGLHVLDDNSDFCQRGRVAFCFVNYRLYDKTSIFNGARESDYRRCSIVKLVEAVLLGLLDG